MANKSTGTDDRDDIGTGNRGGSDVREGNVGNTGGGTGRGIGQSEPFDRDRETIDRDLDDETGSDEGGRGNPGAATSR